MSRNSYRQTGLLPIYKSNLSQDWQLDGYYNNWKNSLQYVPFDTLVSFSTPSVDGAKTAPTEIILRKLNIIGSVKTILSSTTLSVTMYAKQVDGGTSTYYYFIQSSLPEPLDRGCIYEIYIEDSDQNSFISNIFLAISLKDLVIYSESKGAIETESGQDILFE